jgi:hypothetical protein
MTWSYDNSLIADRDKVRFLVGDTDQANQLAQNEEIDWALTEAGDIYAAASLVAETIATSFAGRATKAIGDLKLGFTDQYERYIALSASLKKRLLLNAKAISAGAETESGKDLDEANTELIVPYFTREMHTHDAVEREASEWLQ